MGRYFFSSTALINDLGRVSLLVIGIIWEQSELQYPSPARHFTYSILTTSTCVKSYYWGWGQHSEDVPLSQGRASRGKLVPSSFPQPQSSHQRPCAEMTRRDRKPHQQGGLLLWKQPLRRIKGSQSLTLEEGTGAQGGELVQDAVAAKKKKKKSHRPGVLLPSFPQPTTLPPSPRAWASGGAFQEPHPTIQRESAGFPVGTPRATGVGGS